eukprot:COSAG02_NODE_60593_length_271_cov_0.552326_1_plen_34_part_01
MAVDNNYKILVSMSVTHTAMYAFVEDLCPDYASR